MGERCLEGDVPLNDFVPLVGDFVDLELNVQVIGTFSMYEFIPEVWWNLISTKDIDLQLFISTDQEVRTIGEIMHRHGYVPVAGRVGKWIKKNNDTKEVDLVVVPSCPKSHNPYCLPEPFSLVAKCDAHPAYILETHLGLPNGRLQASGWISNLLGKAAKVGRYINENNLYTNDIIYKKTIKACNDMYLIMSIFASEDEIFIPDEFQSQISNYESYLNGKYEYAQRCLRDLFCESLKAVGHLFAIEYNRELFISPKEMKNRVEKFLELLQ